jgi:glyoxylate reductase
MDSPDRADFLKNLQPGGKYAGISGVYRHNISANKIGIFDPEIISALAETGVKWIGHNGAGYDQINIPACLSKGKPAAPFADCQHDVRSRYQGIEYTRGR